MAGSRPARTQYRLISAQTGVDSSSLTIDDVADILWSFNGSDLTHRLVNERGWSWDRYEQWMGTSLADLLVD